MSIVLTDFARPRLFPRVPRGNTGGANVSATRPLPIPQDLNDLLKHDRRSRLD